MKKDRFHEQREFLHENDMSLEYFARSVLGDKYFQSCNWTDMSTWKAFYINTLDILRQSVFRSIGSIDPAHKCDIEATIDGAIARIRKAQRKDAIHSALIVSLFKLVFLLLGRHPYSTRGKIRELSTFRTLTYCQTEHQLGTLLHSYIQGHAKSLGFADSFAADYAFHEWATAKGLSKKDMSNYASWAKEELQEVYAKHRSL